MVSINQDIRLQFKRADEEYWNDTDPVLEPGEPGYNTNTKFFKIGDGVSTWSELPYQKESSQNYVLNSSFNIWQRATSFTSAGWIADRWYASSVTNTTISRQSRDAGAYGAYVLRLAATNATNSTSIYQPFESGDVKRMGGKTLTFSFYAYSSTGSESLTYSIIKNSTADVSTTGTWTDIVSQTDVMSSSDANDLTRYSITAFIPYDGTAEGLAIKFSTSNITDASEINIFDVQFEDGPAATDFKRRHNTITAESLACYRYYYRWVGGTNITMGHYFNATTFYISLNFPVELRITPTAGSLLVSANNAFAVYSAGAGAATTNVIFSNATNRSSEIAFTTAGGTAGYAGHVTMSAGSWLAFNAELP